MTYARSAPKLPFKPTAVRRSSRLCAANPDDPERVATLVQQVGAALPAWGRAVAQVIDRIQRLTVLHCGLQEGAWDGASLRTLQSLVRDVAAVCESLTDTDAVDDAVLTARTELESVEKHWGAAGHLAAETRAVLRDIEAADLPVPVLDTLLHDLRRSLSMTYDTAAAALGRVRKLAALPWVRRASERVELAGAMAALEASHAGCREVKDRIRRFLAVRALHRTAWTVEPCGAAGPSGAGAPGAIVVRQPRSAVPSPILCFAGPPGCGKTTLAKVIAEALGRPCVTVPLGGVWDEEHVRGLPLSFRAAAPGLIVQGLLTAGVRNPVVILDEIDKVGDRTTNTGNPAAALLEVLDPAQNTAFVDHFVGLPIDLSEVLWIGTANYLDAMPPPLRDRMDVIEVPGYGDDEKVAIVQRHLDRVIERAGLTAGSVWNGATPVVSRTRKNGGRDGVLARLLRMVSPASGEAAPSIEPVDPQAQVPQAAGPPARPVEMTDAAVRAVIRGYTCEAGVRQLLRLVATLCDEVACRRVTTGDTGPVLIVANEGERPDVPAPRRLTVEQVLGRAQHEALPRAVRDVVAREMARVTALPRADPEVAGAFEWVELVADLPWNRRAAPVDAPDLERVLDQAHVACERQKERLLDHVAVGGREGGRGTGESLPCLMGPPGVGKTALARALATALGRGFVEVSLAGVGAAEGIRGSARPRPDAAAGCLLTGLRQLGVPFESRVSNPVVVLEGVDQLAAGPAVDALLVALDPHRNYAFRDHYVGLPVDLSEVTWLATATDPQGIPGPLLDRLDVVSLHGYGEAEKLRIVLEHVIPRQLTRYGLTPAELSFSPAAVQCLIRGYTREAGVKHLERLVGAFVRRVARLGREHGCWPGEIGPEALREGITEPAFREEDFVRRLRRPGVVAVLRVSAAGGHVGLVEACRLAGSGEVRVTGTLGPTMMESAAVAFTWVRGHAARLAGITVPIDRTDIHVHLPSGGRRQDGPSAGVAIATALVSMLTGKQVQEVAMTGEVTLCGDVLPVGSIEEKLLAAARAGMTAVVVPEANRPDVMNVGDVLGRGITVHYAATVEDVLDVALPGVLR